MPRSLVLAALLIVATVLGVGAAPGPPSLKRSVLTQEWMSDETAAALDLGFDVLVPAAVPGPFGGEPSVYAAGGYYSLYWVIYGGDPTFLEITGEVGGDIPDGSVYDLNVPLVVNADVRGSPAYRDLTPIYDTVWWQAGGVVYSVSSRNLTGADSLSLANALVVLPPPVGGGGDGDGGSDGGAAPSAAAVWPPAEVAGGQTVTVWVEGGGVDLVADGGSFVETGTTTFADAGGLGVEWRAPQPGSDLVVSFVLVDRSTGESLAAAETVVAGSGSGGEDAAGGVTGAPDSTEPAGDAASTQDDATESDDGSTEGGPNEVVLGCPAEVIGGRLAPVRLRAAFEVAVEAAQGGWPDEPGNRRFDDTADGGPSIVGVVPDGGAFFLHWRAPTVQTPVEAVFVVRDLDGVELATCTSDVLPAEPAFRLGGAVDGDGSGGPFPEGPPAAGGGAGDGSGGPAVPPGDDGTD